ncbi:MAG TPA: aminopeptidase [Steroidobacteraceae bacterium]|nr:aminopeptidase [Steroidobacteraceae bacterium]
MNHAHPARPLHRVRLLVALLGGAQLAGCYVMHAARGQWDLMSRREPIATVVADPATPAPLKSQLESVVAIRQFSVSALALPDNDSYRSYADIERQYVVWNVFAAPEFSVEPRRWCFPVSGCVSYRGYFNESKARAFAAKLAKRGDDVHVAGVPAYSTLGHFADPVLNTMMNWSDVQLAAIIFHELAHQVLYVQGDSSFNEGFASVVEDEGVRRWLEQAARAADLETFRRQREDYLQVARLFEATRERLRALYARELPPTEMRSAKQAEFEELRRAYEARKRPRTGRSVFDAWFANGLNNALLASVATYQDCVPGLRQLLTEAGDDLPTFYARARELAGQDGEARRARLCGRKE